VEAMKLGAFDYLSKPFTDDELVLVVQKAIEKKSLVEENISLRKELLDRFSFSNIVGKNQRILQVFRQIEKVAPTDTTVVIYGESGTGKELFARAIYAHSLRATRQFIAVDCNTLSPTLLESELFGHVKGAFTGAIEKKAGIFEVAHSGTLFMDDVTNLSMEIQGKLLRVLEMGEYKPVGASQFRKTDVRIIAATNKDPKALVEEGSFREDLFYRLNVFPIYLPPLRERKDDIPGLLYYFLRSWDGVSVPETVDELNRVKKNLLEGYFGQVQKAFLLRALKSCDGNITHAAEKVGMKRPNFYSLMKKHNLTAKANKG